MKSAPETHKDIKSHRKQLRVSLQWEKSAKTQRNERKWIHTPTVTLEPCCSSHPSVSCPWILDSSCCCTCRVRVQSQTRWGASCWAFQNKAWTGKPHFRAGIITTFLHWNLNYEPHSSLTAHCSLFSSCFSTWRSNSLPAFFWINQAEL